MPYWNRRLKPDLKTYVTYCPHCENIVMLNELMLIDAKFVCPKCLNAISN